MRVPFFLLTLKIVRYFFSMRIKSIIAFLSVFAILVSCEEDERTSVISVDGQTEYNLGNKTEMLNIRLNSSSTWGYDLGGAEWISERSRTESSVMLSVSANDTDLARSAVITFFTPAEGTRLSECTIKVSQAAKDIVPEISIEPSDPVKVVSGGQNGISVKVTTNVGKWEAEVVDNLEWVVLKTSSDGVAIDVAPNPLEDPRSASVYFYAPDKNNCQAKVRLAIDQEALVVDYDPVNLSENGTSNCYVITHRGEYSFNSKVRGNGKTVSGLEEPKPISATDAKLLWQSARGMIKSVSFKDGVVSFFANKVNGNALIAVTDASGAILWSWHIWFPSEEITSLHSESGFDVMAFNLGAMSSATGMLESYGLLYQWGRKDPFPGSPVPDNGDTSIKNVDVYDISGNVVKIGNSPDSKTLEYAIANPTICIGNRDQFANGCRDWIKSGSGNDALWGNPDGYVRDGGDYDNHGSKSYYDPCPSGWRVPPIATFLPFTKSGGLAWATGDTVEGLIWGDIMGPTEVKVVDYDKDGKCTLSDWNNGWFIYLDPLADVMTYFPATTRYDGQYALLMGSMVGLWGNYWYNTPSESGGLAEAFSFGLKDYASSKYSITLSPLSSGSKADAFAIRCIKE